MGIDCPIILSSSMPPCLTKLPQFLSPNLRNPLRLLLLHRSRRGGRARSHRRLSTAAAQGTDPQQQQQRELNFSVLRFTLGIPGFDESYLPRWLGVTFGALILVNHFLSSAAATQAQIRSEVLGICIATFSAALPYIGRFLKGANPVDRSSLPEGNKQIFIMPGNVSDALKEDLAWASYALLRNTNSMSVLIAVKDALCIRGYWSTPEDVSKAHMVEWFKIQIQQSKFLDLKDTLYFPQCSDSQFGRILPKGTLSLLVQPVLETSDAAADVAERTEGFVLLASSANYAYGDKERAWIRAVANKLQGSQAENCADSLIRF